MSSKWFFIMVEKAGYPVLTQLGRGDYGAFGKGLLVLYEGLPYMGIVLGVILVRLMFRKDIEKEGSDGENSGSGDHG